MTNLKLELVSEEELRKIIADTEAELERRQDEKLNEKKAKAKQAIEELIAEARLQDRRGLGPIAFECWECENEFYPDILFDGILANVAKVLGG